MLGVLARSRSALAAALLQYHHAGAVVAAGGTPHRCAASSSPGPSPSRPPLYAVLGIDRAATPAQIKAAFRREAKRLHPDVLAARRGDTQSPTSGSTAAHATAAREGQEECGRAAAAAFLQLVEAYEVLSDPERRRLYDTSVDSGLPSTLRSAAAAAAAASSSGHDGGRPGRSTAKSGPGPGWRWGWDAWARDGPSAADRWRGAGAPGGYGGVAAGVYDALERYRSTLEADLHKALLHAFFGPSLEGLGPGELPPAFEAEERSSPDASEDVLQLVSGRTLLGRVRLRCQAALGDGRDRLASRAIPWVERALSSSADDHSSGARLLEGSRPGADASAAEAETRSPVLNSKEALIAAAAAAAGLELTPARLRQLLGAAAEEFVAEGEAAAVPEASQGAGCSSGGRSSGKKAAAAAVEERGRAYSVGAPLATSAAAERAVESGSETETDSDWESSGQQEGGTAPPAVKSEEERRWQEVLAAAHRPKGHYSWAQPLEQQQQFAAALPPSEQGAAVAAALQHAAAVASAVEMEGDGMGAGEEDEDRFGSGSLGAAELLKDWEASAAAVAAASQLTAADSAALVSVTAATDSSSSSSSRNESSKGGSSDATAADSDLQPPSFLAALAEGLTIGLSEALRALGGSREALPEVAAAAEALRSGGTAGSSAAGATSQQEEGEGSERRQRWRRRGSSGGLPRWQWLRGGVAPEADWDAHKWDFDDSSGSGTTVIEVVTGGYAGGDADVAAGDAAGGPRVAAVAVRDDNQEGRPVKVYINGEFAAAIVDGAVLEPFTGAILALVHRSWTPGVSADIVFYRTRRPQPRLLARMRRAWLPPQSTWLFPPREDNHSIGGWYIEWEGHRGVAAGKPGWLHPGVFLSVAAMATLDAEAAPALEKRWRAAAERWLVARGAGGAASRAAAAAR